MHTLHAARKAAQQGVEPPAPRSPVVAAPKEKTVAQALAEMAAVGCVQRCLLLSRCHQAEAAEDAMLAAKATPLQPAPGPAAEELPAVPVSSPAAARGVGGDAAGEPLEHSGQETLLRAEAAEAAEAELDDDDDVWTSLDADVDDWTTPEDTLEDRPALDTSSGVVVDDIAAAIAANALPNLPRPVGPEPAALPDAFAVEATDEAADLGASEEEAMQTEQVEVLDAQEPAAAPLLPPVDGGANARNLSDPPRATTTDGVLRTRHGEYFNPSLRRRIAPAEEPQPEEEVHEEKQGGLLEQASRGLQVASRGLQQARPYIAARMIRYLPAVDPTKEGPVRRPGALTTAHGSYFDSKRRRQLLLQREAAAREQQRAAAEAERAAAAAAVAAEQAAMRRRAEEDALEAPGEVDDALEQVEAVEEAVEEVVEEDSTLPRTADGVRERLQRKLEAQEQSRGWGLFW